MSGNQKFFKCKNCGNMVGVIEDKRIPIVCCGLYMSELIPNTAEASKEKHLPAVTVSDSGLNVVVGGEPHPMEDAHHIGFVYVQTERGGQRKALKTGEEPKLSFSFTDDKPVAVYAYCNLHGLWKTKLSQ